MKRFRSIVIALAALAGTVLILLAAAISLLPQLLDNSAMSNKVGREISSLVGGDFTFERLDIAIIPSPHLLLVEAQLSIEDQFSASLESVELYPDILSLLRGRISIQRIALTQPEATVSISESTAGTATSPQHFDGSTIARALSPILSRLPLIDHGTIAEGRLTLVRNQSTAATFENIDGALHSAAESITLEATAASDLTGKISLKAMLNHRTSAGIAQVKIGSLDLGAAGRAISPGSALEIADGTAEIELALTLHGDGTTKLDFSCAAPRIGLAASSQTADLEALKLTGSAELKNAELSIAISEFQLGHPAMRADGSVGISAADPRLRFDLRGRDIDVPAIREASLALAGTAPAVKTVFNILRAGSIPALTVSGQADAPRDLANLDNLALHGSLAGGTVFIPGADMELSDVSGTVDMNAGILAGSDVAGRWRHSRVQQGTFHLDLTQTPLSLEVDTRTDVQAADVVDILKKFIADERFSSELAHIDDLSGSAAGHLSLSGDLDRLAVAVSAEKLDVKGRHPGLPFPLHISSGALDYDNDQLRVKSLTGSLGTSSFAGLSGSISLGAARTFAIGSGTSRIVVKDILPWLASFTPIEGIAAYYGGGESILDLDKIEVHGSFDELSHVHFTLSGDLADLTIRNLPAQPGPLSIASMQFSAGPQVLSVSGINARMLDGSVQAAGTCKGYLPAEPTQVSISFEGKAGPRIIGWMSEAAGLPPRLSLRPLTFETSRLTYSAHGGHKISANFALQDDLELLAELSFAPRTVLVDSLKVQDQLSRASFNGRKAGTRFDVSFAGTLDDSTIKKIVRLPGLQTGSLAGKASLSGNLENPADLTLHGELSGTRISLHSVPEPPLIIRDITVKGIPEGIAISSAELSWNGAAAKVAGNIWPRAGAWPQFSLDVAADTIDADSMIKSVVYANHKHRIAATSKYKLPALKGEAYFQLKKLIVHGYSIQPLEVDVHFLDDSAEVNLKEAVFCDIPLEGTITLDQQQLSYHAQPKVQSQNLGTTLECLFERHLKADGTVDLTGSFKGHGAVRDLVKSTAGQAEIRVSDGRIYHDIILLNLLKFLNAVQVLTGQVTAEKMMEKGVGFDRFEARVKLQNGILLYDRFILDGEEFKLGGSGKMDIVEKRLDFNLLVAPLKTSSTVLGHLPLIGEILETLDTIPLGVKGTFDDLQFLPLAPSAVADEMHDVMKEAFGIPLKLTHLDDFRKARTRGGVSD